MVDYSYMIERIEIPLNLNGRKCRIHIDRHLFSNEPEGDYTTIIWHDDNNEEIEHCYYNDLPIDLQVQVSKKIEEFDQDMVRKGL